MTGPASPPRPARRLLCTAEAFGYGPSSTLAQVVPRLAAAAPGVELAYLGQGHTLDFHRRIDAYGGRVEEASVETPEGRARFVERCREADALLAVCDFAAAAAAREAGVPFVILDPLAWYWPEIPPVCRDAALWICQDFLGVRERLAREGIENAVVVPPFTPEVEPAATREGFLVSLGGLSNPYFTRGKCADYAAAVLGALAGALEGRGRVLSLTSVKVAAALPGLEVASLTPPEVHAHLGSCRAAFLTPGLGQIYEAAAMGTPVVWLPPANDSQGRQLHRIREAGMAPGAVDWHDFLGCDPVDYFAPQEGVMRILSFYMERLLHDAGCRERLAAALVARLEEAMDRVEEPLPGLVARFGRGGAGVTAKVLARWARAPGAPATCGIEEHLTRTREPGAFPELAPLVCPPQNVGGAEVVPVLEELHRELDGTGFHTLAAALEVARLVRRHVADPLPEDLERGRRLFDASGTALVARYGAGHCTALAEEMARRLQLATGLTAQVVAVRHADSKVPLPLDWEYEGTVHADLLVQVRDPADARVRVVHVVTGMGAEPGHLHVFEDAVAAARHLEDLAYAPGRVVDPGELTRVAFGYKEKLWIVKGPLVAETSEKLGLDLLEGTVFLNGAAADAYAGPRRADGAVAFPAAWARGERAPVEVRDARGEPATLTPREVLEGFLRAAGAQFAQPPDFPELMLWLCANLDPWCEALLCEPGRTLRRERRTEAPRPASLAEELAGELAGRPDVPALLAQVGAQVDAGLAAGGLALPEVEVSAPRFAAAAARARGRADRLARTFLRVGARRARGVAARSLAAELVRVTLRLRALEAARPPADPPEPWGEGERARLAAAMRTPDPVEAGVFRDHVQDGGDLEAFRGALVPPGEGTVPDAEEATGRTEGLRFDLARNTWVSAMVERDPRWSFRLRLRQALDWEIEGLVGMRAEVVGWLTGAARDPVTGAPLVDPRRLEKLVRDLADLRDRDPPAASGVLDAPVDLRYSATDAGDTPVRVSWSGSETLLGDLLALLDDAARRQEVREAAAAARAERRRARQGRLASLAALLERYPGVPARHRRSHWAWVNLAGCGQTVAEMEGPEGVLPRARCRLTPEVLATRFAGPEERKLRFVCNDRFEVNVLSDEEYWEVIARYGFPPNHELLSGTRPILAAGYLTVAGGRVVALEDDGLMIPGKLPPGLPPMQELLEAMGFAIDHETVARASRVLDWQAFARACDDPDLPRAGTGPDLDAAREHLEALGHGARPAAIAAFVRAVLGEVDPNAAVARVLRGYRVINVSGRDVARGDLPRGAEWMDATLAACLVRRARGAP